MSKLFERCERDYCNKCQEKFYLCIGNVPDTCRHCGRHFCIFCTDKETKISGIRKYNHDLDRCSYCINCGDEELRISTKSILKSDYGHYCIKCCISEDKHDQLIQKISKKRQILDQVKTKLEEDYKNTIAVIDNKIEILDKIEPSKKKIKYTKDFNKEYSLGYYYDGYVKLLENINQKNISI